MTSPFPLTGLDEEFESCDDAGITAEEELAEKWMRVLKSKASFSTVSQERRSNASPQRGMSEMFSVNVDGIEQARMFQRAPEVTGGISTHML